jgi:hypothetical protein
MAKSSSNPDANPEDGPVVNVGEPIPKRYFNCVMHEEVQMLRKRGIWCNFGERYNGLKIRILGGLHSEVVSAQGREENREKQRKFGGLTGELDPEDTFAANRRAAPSRIAGVQGDLLVTSEMASVAARHNIPVVTDSEGNRFISFTGAEASRPRDHAPDGSGLGCSFHRPFQHFRESEEGHRRGDPQDGGSLRLWGRRGGRLGAVRSSSSARCKGLYDWIKAHEKSPIDKETGTPGGMAERFVPVPIVAEMVPFLELWQELAGDMGDNGVPSAIAIDHLLDERGVWESSTRRTVRHLMLILADARSEGYDEERKND